MDESVKMESFDAFVVTHFPDEVEGVNEYLDIAQEKWDEGEHEMAYWFAQMAKDEFSHAKYLRHVATMCGIILKDCDVKAFHEAEYRLETIFQ